MKFTRSWLQRHLDLPATVSTKMLADALVNLGLEVEDVIDTTERLAPFVVARILQTQPHPNADKLKLCTVDYGASAPAQVVCGAPNAREGLITIFAPEGTFIPAFEDTLKKAVIRGVESCGMLCSAQELGLKPDDFGPDAPHDGIVALPASCISAVGTSLTQALPLSDVVFDISITPNRSDCFGVRGIARDLMAGGMGSLLPMPALQLPPVGAVAAHTVTIDPAAQVACPQFLCRRIEGIRNRLSPDFLRKNLESVGMTPISVVVDVTNYLSHDQARPLHVFDADKLAGHNLTVRLASEGEQFIGLNGTTYTLKAGMTVIADANGIVSLGGIMGGLDTGCDLSTTNILIECAYFDPLSIAKTGQATTIVTDARQRLERGVDTQSARSGLDQATAMILELCATDATVLGPVIEAGCAVAAPSPILFDPHLVRRLTGLEADISVCQTLLERLGCHVTPCGDQLTVVPPTWRHDLRIPQDLVEEVIRLMGYDTLPSTPLPLSPDTSPHLSPSQRLQERTKRLLAMRGMTEAITYAFTSSHLRDQFGDSGLEVVNPITQDHTYLRPTLLGPLCAAVAFNLNRGTKSLALFELGARFGIALPDHQETSLGLVLCGNKASDHWSQPTVAWSIVDVKAHMEAVLALYGLEGKYQITQDPDTVARFPYMHPTRTAVVRQGPKIILGYFGEVHPHVIASLTIKQPIMAAELYMDRLALPKTKGNKAPFKLSPFPSVERDLAVVVAASMPVGPMLSSIMKACPELLQSVHVFDVYAGKGVPDGQKSVGIRLTLQSPTATLSEGTIVQTVDHILASLIKNHQAVLR